MSGNDQSKPKFANLIDRRVVLTGFGASSLVAASHVVAQPSDRLPASSLTRPPRLKLGDKIGLVAPSGATYAADDRDLADEVVRASGWVPVHGTHFMDRYGYFAIRSARRVYTCLHHL